MPSVWASSVSARRNDVMPACGVRVIHWIDAKVSEYLK
jgi:hypothetical protein